MNDKEIKKGEMIIVDESNNPNMKFKAKLYGIKYYTSFKDVPFEVLENINNS